MRSSVAWLLAVIAFAAPVEAAQPTADYLVVLSGAPGSATAARLGRAQRTVADAHGLAVGHSFRHVLNGFSARLTPAQVARLERDSRVAAVEPDVWEEFLPIPTSGAAGGSAATTPATTPATVATAAFQANPRFVDDSLRRIEADTALPDYQNGIDDERPDVDIAIVDSGIAPLTDLNVAGGYNCTSTKRGAYSDVYGHGTEVASVAAALDNDDGIVGLLPGARVWAVKMITDGGYLSTSMTLCALDWITGQRDPRDPARPLIEVANMSFTQTAGAGSPVDDGNCGASSGDRLHQAICRMTQAGTIAVAAAGNHGRLVGSRRPAAFREVVAVSALADFDGRDGRLAPFDEACRPEARDEDDTFANFSNYGPQIDIIAPGVCITMPWIRTGGNLHQQSGTSFAAPLVAAAIALYRLRYPNASPAQVRHAVVEGATGTWARSTDPDGRPDRLLNLAALAPPDTIAPAASFARIGFATGRRSAASRASLALVLRAEDARSSSFSFVVQQSVAGGEWLTVARGSSASAVVSVPFGESLRFRLRATDEAGNVGRWRESPPLVARLIDSASRSLGYGAGWATVAQSTAFEGSVRRSSAGGSQVSLVVDARAVAVAVTAGPDRGRGRLTVDGEQVSFDTLRSTSQTRRVVAAMAWNDAAPRSVALTVLGTSGRPRLDFDALLVLTAP